MEITPIPSQEEVNDIMDKKLEEGNSKEIRSLSSKEIKESWAKFKIGLVMWEIRQEILLQILYTVNKTREILIIELLLVMFLWWFCRICIRFFINKTQQRWISETYLFYTEKVPAW